MYEKPLVNFRVSLVLINAFDDACRLAGSTRTDILIRLMKSYIEVSADQLPKQLAEERQSIKTLKNAVRRVEQRRRASAHQKAGSPLRAVPKPSFTGIRASVPVRARWS